MAMKKNGNAPWTSTPWVDLPSLGRSRASLSLIGTLWHEEAPWSRAGVQNTWCGSPSLAKAKQGPFNGHCWINSGGKGIRTPLLEMIESRRLHAIKVTHGKRLMQMWKGTGSRQSGLLSLPFCSHLQYLNFLLQAYIIFVLYEKNKRNLQNKSHK